MDKLKPYLSGLARNQFWILSAVLVVTAFTVWYMATGEIDAKFERDKRITESTFSSIDANVLYRGGTNQLPNAHYAEEVQKVREKLSAQVIAAWDNLFVRQLKALKVSPRVGAIEPYLMTKEKWKSPIPDNLRRQFRDNQVIEDEFRDLFSILDLRRMEGTNPVDVQPEAGTPTGLIVWAASPSPRQLMDRYRTTDPPSSERIRMMYEDLWVFRSIFKMISKINERPVRVWLDVLEGEQPAEGAVDQANVPIKQINYCDLAQYAMSAATGSAGLVVGNRGTPEEDEMLLANRYLDGRNNPVPDPRSPPFAEFKQIFVQLTVVMDQRLIPVLITECANADITIETRQLIVDLDQIDKPKKGDAQEAKAVVNRYEQGPNDCVVTLRGVLYGYSPPEAERLGTGSDAEPSNRNYGIPMRQ